MPRHPLEDFALRHLDRLEREGPEALDAIVRENPESGPEFARLVGNLARFGLIGTATEAVKEPGQRFGRFVLRERLGEGGMGTVWLAEPTDGGEPVALKLLPTFLLGSDRARERFRREAEILRRLDHPGLCPVVDAGEIDSAPFLALQHVRGETLASILARRRQEAHGPDEQDVRAGIGLVARLARALDTAHEAGIVHRDIKPSNVIVDERGEPVLIDFGLAHADGLNLSTLTRTGAVLGTPASMAPEQVRGGEIDRRTDVYGLGALLYECVTLRPVFEERSIEAIYRDVLTRAPRPARRWNSAVSASLRDVLEVALAKDPTHRFTTAASLADELERILRGERSKFRRPTSIQRLARWAHINRAAAIALAAISAGLLATLSLLAVNLHTSQQRLATLEALQSLRLQGEDPVRAFEKARDALDKSSSSLVVEQAMATAGSIQERRRITIADSPTLLRRVRLSPDHTRLLAAPEFGSPVLVQPDGTQVLLEVEEATAWSSGFVDDTTIAVGGKGEAGAIVRLFDADGRAVRNLHHGPLLEGGRPALQYPIRSLAIASDGRIAAAGADGAVSLWDADGTRLGPNRGIADGMLATEHVAFSPDGGTLVAIALNLAGRRFGAIWPGAAHTAVPFDAGSTRVHAIAVGAESIAIASDSGLQFLSLDGTSRPVPQEEAGGCIGLSIDDSGARFASCHLSGLLLIHDSDGAVTARHRTPGPVSSAAFLGNTNILAAGGWDEIVRVFSIVGKTLALDDELIGHRGQISHVLFTGDGKVFSAAWDRTVRMWRGPPSAPWVHSFGGTLSKVSALGEDGTVVAADPTGAIHVLEPVEGQPEPSPPGDGNRRILRARATSSDQGTLALAYERWSPDAGTVLGEVAILRTGDSSPRRLSFDHTILAIALDGSGRTLYYARHKKVWRLRLDRDDADPELALDLVRSAITGMAWSSNGPTLWTGHEHGGLHGWNPNDPHHETSHRFGGRNCPSGTRLLHSIAVSPDGQFLVTVGQEAPPRVWQVTPTGPRRVDELRGHEGAVHGARWSPDGVHLLTWSVDQTAKLWDADTLELEMTLRGHRRQVNDGAFLADGRIVTVSSDGMVRSWWPEAGALRAVLREFGDQLLPAGYVRDSR